MDEITREVLLGISALTAGLALWLAVMRVQRIVRQHHTWDVWYLLIDVGIAIAVLLIAQAVFGAVSIPLTWQTVLYAISLVSISAGLVGVAVTAGHHNKRSTDP